MFYISRTVLTHAVLTARIMHRLIGFAKVNVSNSLFARSQQHKNLSISAKTSAPKVQTYSYVIVGAGSAGCVLANRLSEDPDNSVLLLEAGPKDTIWNSKRLMWKIHMPAALIYNLCDDKYNWYYHTVAQKHMNNRVMYWPRGRVWGGSSSLNAMVYIRGHAEDYNRWERQGAIGWDYDHCLPYFRKAQCHELGADRYRGGNGPLQVSRGKTNHPLHIAFLEAGQQAGYPFTDDMNGFQQEGVGWMDMTIYKGKRWSAATAYLSPALLRRNLTAEEKTFVTKILFDGTKAIGVEYIQAGLPIKVYAKKEVILSGGSINSPQLLMLSGIGNADDLKALGIPVVCHRPGVGQNLQDHLELYVQQQCTEPITLYQSQKPFKMIRIGLEWLWKFTGRILLPSNNLDLEININTSGSVHVGPMRPTSVGWMKLKSANPTDHPIIEPNYLSTETDVLELRESVKLSREIFAQKAFDRFRGPEITPGSHIQTDKEIDSFVREKADSAYHPSCTCKMGQPSDPMAVVDPETRVIGVENLRVVDSSIMPSVVSGNLNAPTIMLAEKAADIIKGCPVLCDKDVPVYKHKS
ncbi:choline dehydrogenase, mitochondrial [Rhincodon typus]|uniref:choline dehydrogenase, mitochondrial n=1 Tax=Rhincodon typus TaxID=259920 RepID=UPI00202DE8A1|nr:choline dehydrogenase, mitochondrial [Rhincodon typus]